MKSSLIAPMFFSIFFMEAVLPQSSFAETLVVARGPYILSFENTSSAVKARLFAEAVAKAASKSASPADRDVQLVEDSCADVQCLKQLAKAKHADRAVMARVTENVGHYSISLIFLDKTVVDEHTGSFAEAVDKVVQMTENALGKEQSDIVQVESPSVSAPASIPSAGAKTAPRIAPKNPTPQKKPIHKAVFFSIVGCAVSSTVGLGITAGLAQSSWDKLESDHWSSLAAWRDERDRYHHLQVASRALIGVTGGLFLLMIPVGFFTDFSRTKNVAFAVSADGFFSVKGSF